MNAMVQTAQAQFEPMTPAWLDAVMEVETRAYPHPWSRGNFADSLRAGYQAQLLVADQTLIGYFLALKGVDEVHLLNITVAPAYQRQGWGRIMLEAVSTWARGQGAQWLWLEVRPSNQAALRLYDEAGFGRVGRRKSYYALADGQREDAIVMSLKL